jgi:hypothetical protein
MPDCHRCERTFASGELRRTPKGHVCKDTIACRRRLFITKSYVVDSDLIDRFAMHARGLDDLADGHDPIKVLRLLSVLRDDLTDVAMDVVDRAARETKLTQKQIAEALDVPVSMLRGLKQSVR